MARSHGRVLTKILTDPDFRTLSESAQRLYLILLAQQDLNTAGVMSINYRRWSRACATTSPEHIQKVARELDERRYVLLDEETEEAFVRSLIRNDGIVKQPQMFKNALRVAEQVESPRLRAALAVELRRLGRDDACATADAIDPGDPPKPPPPGPNGRSNHSPIQADGSLAEALPQPAPSLAEPCADPGGVGVGEGVVSSFVSTSVLSDEKSSDGALSTKDEPTPRRSRRNDEPDGFAEWYGAFPRHEARAKAASSYRAALRKRGITAESLLAGARRYTRLVEAEGREHSKILHPATWLNQERWNDEMPAVINGRHLVSVPVAGPVDPAEGFADLRRRAAGEEAARVLGIPYLVDPRPPSDPTHPRQWARDRAVEWIDNHADAIRAAFAQRRTG